MAQTPGLTAHRIWQWYERGVERHRMAGLYEKTEQAHRFFAGDQWAGVESGGELLPKYNFIQSIVEYKVAGVASNTLTITYTPLESGGPQQPQAALPKADRLCRPAMGTAQNGQIVLERGKRRLHRGGQLPLLLRWGLPGPAGGYLQRPSGR